MFFGLTGCALLALTVARLQAVRHGLDVRWVEGGVADSLFILMTVALAIKIADGYDCYVLRARDFAMGWRMRRVLSGGLVAVGAGQVFALAVTGSFYMSFHAFAFPFVIGAIWFAFWDKPISDYMLDLGLFIVAGDLLFYAIAFSKFAQAEIWAPWGVTIVPAIILIAMMVGAYLLVVLHGKITDLSGNAMRRPFWPGVGAAALFVLRASNHQLGTLTRIGAGAQHAGMRISTIVTIIGEVVVRLIGGVWYLIGVPLAVGALYLLTMFLLQIFAPSLAAWVNSIPVEAMQPLARAAVWPLGALTERPAMPLIGFLAQMARSCQNRPYCSSQRVR
jgi:hypothetical protein